MAFAMSGGLFEPVFGCVSSQVDACLVQTPKDANGATVNNGHSTKDHILSQHPKASHALFPSASQNCQSVKHSQQAGKHGASDLKL